METEDAAAAIHNSMEEVRRRSLCKRSWTIDEAAKDMRTGEWERRHRLYSTLQDNAGLAKVDPWHLPPRFIMPKEPGNNLSLQTTRSGYWKEKEGDLTAIRGEGSSSSTSPAYQGVRRTMEFYEHSGTNTDWVIHEYQLLHPDKKDKSALFLQEDVVLRKVFNKSHTDKAPADFRHLDTLLNLYGEKQDNPGDTKSGFDFWEVSLFSKSILWKSHTLEDYSEEEKMTIICNTIERLNPLTQQDKSGCEEFPTAPGVLDGEADVWQHFTRINTKDPDVVYAACHHCDRVLKAHSKNGTSHLRRHCDAKTCISCNNNLSSTAEDLEILRDLRANLDLYKQGKEGGVDSPDLNASLGKVDPWDLPPRHFTTSLNWETHQGHWKEVNNNNKFTAIRIGQSLPVPHYVGMKRTLEFHHNNGTKMDWIMLEYYQVDEYMPPSLLLEGSMVFRKVFQSYEDAVRELSRMWDRDDDAEECFNGESEEGVKAFMDTLLHECLLDEDVHVDQPQSRKRKRSEIWLHFTNIYTTDPKRVYAVCHCCDRGYKAHPKKDGTSHLKRHNKKCSSKQQNFEGMKQYGRLH